MYHIYYKARDTNWKQWLVINIKSLECDPRSCQTLHRLHDQATGSCLSGRGADTGIMLIMSSAAVNVDHEVLWEFVCATNLGDARAEKR